jgi:GDSL-like Lipase/Acylhydrolase family
MRLRWFSSDTFKLGIVLALAGAVRAGDHVLVLGDSLTKEYQSEFKVLFPTYPASWEARNWVELLDARRQAEFDLGAFQVFTDLRLTGHEYNWARPGGTAREFRNFLRQDAAAQAEITAGNGASFWNFFPTWRTTFTNYTGTADKVVIFFGGNDLALGNSEPSTNPSYNGRPKQVDYESIYAGTFGEASNPDLLETSIRKNILSIMQWFRVPRTVGGVEVVRFTGPMILCGVPHVGATPKVQQDAGTDPVRTLVLTQMIERLNVDLRNVAAMMDIGFADVYPITKQILDPGVFRIGGVAFRKEADNDCRPRYLFSGDGFHPNTAVHAKVAQVVADAFRAKYLDLVPTLPRLTDREIITEVLGLPGDIGYVEWMAAAGVPAAQRGPLSDPDKDGIPNAMEYALAGRTPDEAEQSPPFLIGVEPAADGPGQVLVVTWRPRYAENAYCDLVPQVSAGLRSWQAVSPEEVATLANGSRRVSLPMGDPGELFFRLAAVRP